ncbi:hypothetical protein JCGZ_04920 [Jatropha curcas]|uniref:Uncharacterized protein n=1 Tax=Jatropha curcas TaxID=180498 RepID=A0A067JCS1_JATCU|nr:hypothetical protein JCGZ_04920 [Jatropha curcas]
MLIFHALKRLENHPQRGKRKPRSKAFQAYSSLLISTTESSTQRVDFYHAQVRSGGCSSRPEDEHQSRYHILDGAPAPIVASTVWFSGIGRWVLHFVVSEHRYLVMSQRLPDEEVDSYVPPEGAMLEGGRPAGGVAGGILGSDAECASAEL